ncbi:MAG: putative signal transducing protein [Pseudomonadota bacterium]|jgi:hypothetical protein
MPRVYVASDLVDAQLLADVLHGHGIAARILNAHAAGALGELSFIDVRPEVWVSEPRDVARAELVVAAHDRRGPSAPDRRCASCGEPNPASFASCWQCGGWVEPAESA